MDVSKSHNFLTNLTHLQEARVEEYQLHTEMRLHTKDPLMPL